MELQNSKDNNMILQYTLGETKVQQKQFIYDELGLKGKEFVTGYDAITLVE